MQHTAQLQHPLLPLLVGGVAVEGEQGEVVPHDWLKQGEVLPQDWLEREEVVPLSHVVY